MANIYLNEFDRFVKHQLKPLAYLRYGDDWLCFADKRVELEAMRAKSVTFLREELSLRVNPKIDYIRPAYRGVEYLGVQIWPSGRRLQLKPRQRVINRLQTSNASSYKALVAVHEKPRRLKSLNWRLMEIHNL